MARALALGDSDAVKLVNTLVRARCSLSLGHRVTRVRASQTTPKFVECVLHSGPRARADFQRVAAHMGYRNEVRYALTPSSVAKNGDLIKTTGDDTFALTAKGERLVKERFENEYPQLEPLFRAALDALGLEAVLLLQAHAVPVPDAALKAEAAAALKTLTLAHRKRAFELFQDMDVDEDDDAAVAAAHRAAKRRADADAPVPEEATALRAALTAVTTAEAALQAARAALATEVAKHREGA